MPAGGARGFRVSATQQQSQSLAVPRIDARPYVAEAEAAGAIGDGVQKLGDGMQRLAVARFDAINKRRAAEADIVFDKASSDLAVELAKEKDTNKWDAIAGKHTKGIADIVNDPTLSINARDEIERRYNRWSTRTIGEVKLSGAVREGQLAGETIRGAAMIALRDRDFGRAAELYDSSDGVLGPAARASLYVDIENAKESSEQESVDSDVNGYMAPGVNDRPAARKRIEESNLRPEQKVNRLAQLDHQFGVNEQNNLFDQLAEEEPDAAIDAANDRTQFTFLTDRAGMVNRAKRVKVSKSIEAFNKGKEAIDLGGFGGLDKADDLNGPDFKWLTPHQKLELSQYLDKRMSVEGMNNDETYLKAITDIEKFLPDETGLKEANLKATIATNFSGPKLEELLERLRLKTDPENSSSSSVLSDAYSVLDDWAMKDQKFGSYKVQATGTDGFPLFKKEKQLTVGDRFGMDQREVDVNVPVMIEDPVKRDGVTKNVLSLKDQLRKLYESGDITTHSEALSKLSELTRMQVPAAAAAAALKRDEATPYNPIIPSITPNPVIITPDEAVMDPALKAILERQK